MGTAYKSGEEPRVGDVVRLLSPILCTPRPVEIGDVFEAKPSPTSSGDVELRVGGEWATLGGWLLKNFTLIARAGEVVKLQPGDVVEALEDYSTGQIGRRLTQGRRYTVKGLSIAYSDGCMIEACDAGYVCHWPGGTFRLVHRPATSVEAPAAPPQGERLNSATARPLKVGDVVVIDYDCGNETARKLWSGVAVVEDTYDGRLDSIAVRVNGMSGAFSLCHVTFIGRPDADGWITWAGGENPVPGVRVDVRHRDGDEAFAQIAGESCAAEDWTHDAAPHPGDIVAFRIAKDEPAAAPVASGSEEAAFKVGDRVVYWPRGRDFASSIPGTIAEVVQPGTWRVDWDGQGRGEYTYDVNEIRPHDEPIRTIADVARDLRPVRVEDVKPGDTVLVRVKVCEVDHRDAHKPLRIERVTEWPKAESFAGHEPAPAGPLSVGDSVVGPYSDDVGEIRHIAQGIAAVEFSGNFYTIALDDLGRVS